MTKKEKITLCIIYLMMTISFMLSFQYIIPYKEQKAFERDLNEKFESYNTQGSQGIALKDMTKFDWDRVYFIEAYAEMDDVLKNDILELRKARGVHIPGYVDESQFAILFVEDDKIVKAALIHSDRKGVPGYHSGGYISYFSREEAVFGFSEGLLYLSSIVSDHGTNDVN
jgi:hypothetical protein